MSGKNPVQQPRTIDTLRAENRRLKQTIEDLTRQLEARQQQMEHNDKHWRQAFDGAVQQIDRLVTAEVEALRVVYKIDALVLYVEGEPLIIGLMGYTKDLLAWRSKVYEIMREGGGSDQHSPGMMELVEQHLEAIRRFDDDGGAALRELARKDDPVILSVLEAAARQQAKKLEAEREKHIPLATRGEQRLIESAVAELRSVRKDREGYSLPRLRNHYVSKYEGRVPDDKREVYEKIRTVTERTLYNWENTYGKI